MIAISTDSLVSYPFSSAGINPYGFISHFIKTYGENNEFRMMYVVDLSERILSLAGKRIYSAGVAVLGLAYKKNINGFRESPSIKVIDVFVNIRVSRHNHPLTQDGFHQLGDILLVSPNLAFMD